MNDYERVLLYKQQQVCLFKIPPISTSKGYYLDDWKEMFWEGGVKLIEKGSSISLQFVNQNDGSIVANSPLPDDPYVAIQKTVDSQRGYAIRLTTPQGQYQWVGCVFRDRNDAFDLNAVLQDYINIRERERNPHKFKDEFVPTNDFSLKQGQKIQISLDGNQGQKKQQKSTQQTASLNAFKFGAPPDEQVNVNNFQENIVYSKVQMPVQNQNQFGDFSNDWNNFSTNPQQPQQPNNFSWSFSPPVVSQSSNQTQQQQNKPKDGGEFNLLDL